MSLPHKERLFQQFRTLQTVCRQAGCAAARKLGSPTSTVWEQMRGMERCFEASPSDNRESGIRPTAAGNEAG